MFRFFQEVILRYFKHNDFDPIGRQLSVSSAGNPIHCIAVVRMPLLDAIVIRRRKAPTSVYSSIALSDRTGQRSRQRRGLNDHDTISHYSFIPPLTGVH
jgi:hypothetical protein